MESMTWYVGYTWEYDEDKYFALAKNCREHNNNWEQVSTALEIAIRDDIIEEDSYELMNNIDDIVDEIIDQVIDRVIKEEVEEED